MTSAGNSAPKSQTGTPPGRRIARALLLLLALIFLVGMTTGFLAAHQSDGGGSMTLLGQMVLGLFLLCGLAAFIQIIRDLSALFRDMESLNRRERASARLMAVALGVGAVSGIAGGIVSSETDWLTSGTFPPALAIALTAALCILGPWFTVRWWRAIDEHEQAAYVEGANISGHFILFGGIAWWLLSRAALVPAPDVMILIVAMSFVWTGVWYYRKFN
jgi:hypothetical protein